MECECQIYDYVTQLTSTHLYKKNPVAALSVSIEKLFIASSFYVGGNIRVFCRRRPDIGGAGARILTLSFCLR